MYAFLSQPPPPPTKKTSRHVPAPLSPSRPTNKSAISLWASKVHPGSPAPCSPPTSSPARSPAAIRRRTSVNRRASLTHHSHSRRPSVGGQKTPSTADYHPDLTAFGYTSLFIQFDKTPTTPSPFRQPNAGGVKGKAVTPLTSEVFGSIPIPPVPAVPSKVGSPTSVVSVAQKEKPKQAKRFRSFSILRSKKSKLNENTSTKSKGTTGQKASKPKTTTTTAAPPSLANELALMQFIGGGSMEDNVKKVMHARSKAISKSTSGIEKAMEDVYRDENGGIWFDKDEELEYVHLLSFEDEGDDKAGEWEDEVGISPGLGNGVVVKAASPYTNAYCPIDIITLRTPTTSSSNSPSLHLKTPSRPLLVLPSRPRRRRCSHLANPPSFLLDLNVDAIEAFLPRTPRSPNFKRRPSGSFTTGGTSPSSQKQKKLRPRPAPLKLTSAQSAHARANAKVEAQVQAKAGKAQGSKISSGSALEKARKEFVEDSFKPESNEQGVGRKVSRMDVRGVFGLNL